MKELHTFGWYAARVSPHMPKKAFKPVPARLWGGLAYCLIVIASMTAIGVFNLHPLIKLVLAVVIGMSFAGLGFLAHEILHGTVIRNRKMRDVLGAIAFWPFALGPKLWRKWHNMEHHHHTQDEHLDPDAWLSIDELYERPFMNWVYRLPLWLRSILSFMFLSVSFTLHSSRMFQTYIGEFKPKERPVVWAQLLLPWATWLSLIFFMGFTNWVFAFLIPLLIGNFMVMAYISTNHRLNPLVDVNDPLANSLSVTVPKWVDVIHFNFSYHAEHHLFPGMSSKYFPEVKDHIKRMWPDRYHEMPLGKALIALWKTPRVYYKQNELVDPHKGHLYGSLGNGLNPEKPEYREFTEAENEAALKAVSSAESKR